MDLRRQVGDGMPEAVALPRCPGREKVGKGKKFEALICQETPSCARFEKLWFDEGMAKQAGLQAAYRARVSIAQPDFTSECIGARNAGSRSAACWETRTRLPGSAHRANGRTTTRNSFRSGRPWQVTAPISRPGERDHERVDVPAA